MVFETNIPPALLIAPPAPTAVTTPLSVTVATSSAEEAKQISGDGSVIGMSASALVEPKTASVSVSPIAQGWVARRWDPAFQERFAKLLGVFGRELDGKIEGINLPETSTSTWRRRRPKGYTKETYRDGIKANMKAARDAFPKSIVLQYANFMPGERLPQNDRGYLKSIYEYAAEIGVAVASIDLRASRCVIKGSRPE